MPYKNPDDRRRADRERKRRKRGAGADTGKKMSCPPESARDVLALIGRQIAIIETAKADPLVRARAIARLAEVYLKANEQADLAKRIEEIEATMEGKMP